MRGAAAQAGDLPSSVKMLHSLVSQLRLLTSSSVSAVVHHPLPVTLSLVCGCLAYYWLRVVRVPELVSKPDSAWTAYLRTHVPILQEKYWCSVWCFEGRLQTLVASLLGATAPPLRYRREILPLWDGGQISLDWIEGPPAGGTSPPAKGTPLSEGPTPPVGGKATSPASSAAGPTPQAGGTTSPAEGATFPAGDEATRLVDAEFPIEDAPLLMILPGLTGSSASEYVKDFVRAGHAAGYKCVVMNNRGKGGVPLKTPRTYCAANCDDFAAAIEHIRARYHRARAAAVAPSYARSEPLIVVVGISLGGMILCHYLCQRQEAARRSLTAAVGVSVPYDVFLGTTNLEKPLLNYLLNRHLAGCLCRSVQELAPMLESSTQWRYEEVVKSTTIREFDSRFTAPQFGYADVTAYYTAASLHRRMGAVGVPFLGLAALDDPFQPGEGLPTHVARTSDHVALCLTTHGGHIGFLEGVWGGRWGARLLRQLLAAVRLHPGFTGSMVRQIVKCVADFADFADGGDVSPDSGPALRGRRTAC